MPNDDTLRIDTARVFLPLLKPSRYKGAFGGRGCVAGETLLDTPTGPVRIDEFRGGPIWSWDGERVVPGTATAPRSYCVEDMYALTLSDGRSVLCTDRHRVMTPRGWIAVGDLSDAVAVARDQGAMGSLYRGNDCDFLQVKSIEKRGRQIYWDVHVPGTHCYFAHGILHHNSGKSHHFAESVVEHCIAIPGARVVCVREVQRSLKESVKRLIEDKIQAFGAASIFKPFYESIQTPGNGVILFQGMKDHTAESIKSLEGFDIAYAEEAQTLSEMSLEMLRPTIRGSERMKALGRTSEIWFSWNPRHASDPVDKLLRGEHVPDDAVVVRTSWRDNPWFPEELMQERLFDLEHRTERYYHVWEGEYEPVAIGAIWSREMIQRNRRDTAPQMGRIVVAIDPAKTNTPESDETGIIVTGLGHDKRGYVLADYSLKASPAEWAEKAVAAYELYDADAIVAEVNAGGDMVEHTIHTARPDIRVIKINASRGKHVRAEPISALYALDRVSHIGTFTELENEMCLFTAAGYDGDDSPDRADALVYGLTELFPKLTKRGKVKDGPLPSRANNRYNPLRR